MLSVPGGRSAAPAVLPLAVEAAWRLHAWPLLSDLLLQCDAEVCCCRLLWRCFSLFVLRCMRFESSGVCTQSSRAPCPVSQFACCVMHGRCCRTFCCSGTQRSVVVTFSGAVGAAPHAVRVMWCALKACSPRHMLFDDGLHPKTPRCAQCGSMYGVHL